jgi:nucleotide-binding universal stress UspA family protein
VLIPVAFSSSGPQLLDLAVGLARGESPRIYALHVPRPVERGVLGADAPRPEASGEQALGPLLARAQERGLDPHPLTITSNAAATPICEVARLKHVELIVMGWHRPVFRRSVLSGTLEQVMRGSEADVAVFVDRGAALELRRILVPYTGTAHDRAALRRALTLARRARAELTVLHVVREARIDPQLEDEARQVIETETQDRTQGIAARLVVVEASDPLAAVLERAAQFDLIVVGIGAEWDLNPAALGVRQERIAAESPVPLLIVRGGSTEPPP